MAFDKGCPPYLCEGAHAECARGQLTWVTQHQGELLKVLQQHHMALGGCQILTPLHMHVTIVIAGSPAIIATHAQQL